jgi:hypothetical protein
MPHPIVDFPYINLGIVPFVHTQGFHLGYMCTKLPMESGAPHAEEYAELDLCQHHVRVRERISTVSPRPPYNGGYVHSS